MVYLLKMGIFHPFPFFSTWNVAIRGGKCVESGDCNFAHGEDELRVSPNVYKTQRLGSCKSYNIYSIT